MRLSDVLIIERLYKKTLFYKERTVVMRKTKFTALLLSAVTALSAFAPLAVSCEEPDTVNHTTSDWFAEEYASGGGSSSGAEAGCTGTYVIAPSFKAVSDWTTPALRKDFAEQILLTMDSIDDFRACAMVPLPEEDTPILSLKALGIMIGDENGDLHGEDCITREEAAVIMTRVTDFFGIERASAEAEDDEISGWAKDSVSHMMGMDIMHGVGSGFDPQGTYTVEQSVAVSNRLISKLTYAVCLMPSPSPAPAEGENPAAFASRLNALMPEDENYMFSPLSIKLALLMTANGAEGETKQEMLDAFGIKDLDAFNKKTAELMKLYESDDAIELKIANAIWHNTSMMSDSFLPSFKQTVADYYGGAAEEVSNTDAVDRINSWCDEHTNGKIPTIIDNSDFAYALTNAVYFKGDWQSPFTAANTSKGEFTERGGSSKTTDFMHQTAYFQYAESGDTQVLRMPYKRSEGSESAQTAMYVILSGENERPDLEKIFAMPFTSQKVRVTMPKFESEWSKLLNPYLNALGINTAFDTRSADFSNMCPKALEYGVYIESVLHKTYIKVDEKGSEAAAVTAIAVGSSAAPKPETVIDFTADRPFTYVIRDDSIGEILFAGEYAYVK